MKKNLLLILLSTCLVVAFYSCDTPLTFAWSYYGQAKDSMDVEKPYVAMQRLKLSIGEIEYIKRNEKLGSVPVILEFKVDSLMRVIEKSIKELESDTIVQPQMVIELRNYLR